MRTLVSCENSERVPPEAASGVSRPTRWKRAAPDVGVPMRADSPS